MNFYYWVGYHLSWLLGKIFFRLRILHRERMINSGPVIVASNHQSYLDPPFVGVTADRAMYFLARRTLLKWPVLGPLLPKVNVIPVDQESADRTALKSIIRVLRAGEGVLVFPEGSRTLDGNLLPAEPGLGFIIAKTLAPVVPIRIFGAHEAFPRNGKPRLFRRITLVVGEPMQFTESDLQPRDKELFLRLSQRVMERIAALQIDG